jgi:multidrug transporter EmrE-like cation transporter
MNIYIVLVLTIILNSAANIFIKVAMNNADKTRGLIGQCVFNPYFIGGALAFAAALITYSYVLMKMKLSLAYPVIVSSCFLVVLATSWFYLKEDISVIQMFGVLFVTAGIWLILK